MPCWAQSRDRSDGRSGARRAAQVRTLAIDYRRAPEHPYPAAHEDALTAWRFLRAQGIAAEHIAVGGDSSGGNLALGLISRLRSAGESLPACGWPVWNAALEDGRRALDNAGQFKRVLGYTIILR